MMETGSGQEIANAGSSTVTADHGSANNLLLIPMKPPNDITAYATRPVVTSIINSSIRPMS